MMKRKLILFSIIALFALTANSYAQNDELQDIKKEEKEILSHKVEPGETVIMISKKYLVKPTDIYDINPDAVHGIQQNMVIKIPADKIRKKLNDEQRSKIKREWVTVKGKL